MCKRKESDKINLNYAIFRSEPIMTLSDLAQIGAHNKRENKAHNSNPDKKKELSHNNIELVPLNEKYVKDISVATTKQDQLFEYSNIPDYYKERVRDKDECVNHDFELER